MQKLYQFLVYNNTLPIIAVFLLVSGGTVLAANEDVRSSAVEAVISSESAVVSVDNSLITTINLDTFEPAVQVVDVDEDGIFYLVTYSLTTIEISDAVWQEVTKTEVLQVSKEQLGEKDLGLHLAKEFSELIRSITTQLREAQIVERELGSKKKVVRTEYSGLIGRFLDVEDSVFDGYDPVIAPEIATIASVVSDGDKNEEATQEKGESAVDLHSTSSDSDAEEVAVIAATTTAQTEVSTSTPEISGEMSEETNSTTTSATTSDVFQDSTAPVITLVGPDELSLESEEIYEELGAVAQDDTDGDVTNIIQIEGVVSSGSGVYRIEYSVVDAAGNSARSIRKVTRLEPSPPTSDSPEGGVASSTDVSTE